MTGLGVRAKWSLLLVAALLVGGAAYTLLWPKSSSVTMLLALAQTMAPEYPAQSHQPSHHDVVYATIDNRALALDIYLPDGVEEPPLMVWVHGGAWMLGNKGWVQTYFVDHGIAIASVEYRLSTDAQFPAQVHDIKAAIRFLRANAGQFGYNAERIVIAGESAGAHLAALVGTTNGHAELEGTLGNHRDTSSRVQAILSFFGASNLTSILGQSTPHGVRVREPALTLLLGEDYSPDIARLASPVFHVDPDDPPLLLLHGDQDHQMPINQSHELDGAYQRSALDVAFDVVHGAGHGGEAFYTGIHRDRALAFIARTIGAGQ